MLPIILGIVRHLLTWGGGLLADKGLLGLGDVETAVMSILALIGVVWSIVDKIKNPPAPAPAEPPSE